MSVEDRWHYKTDAAATRAGVTVPCTCRTRSFPTKDHGRGNQWRVRIPGLPVQSFAKKTDADAHDKTAGADRLRGIVPTSPRLRQKPEKFGDYARAFLATRRYTGGSAETVMSRMEQHVFPVFEHRDLPAILISSAEGFLATLSTKLNPRTGRPYAPSTVEAIYDAFAMVMKAAHRDGKIQTNPCASVSYPHAPERPDLVPWTDEMVATVIEALPERQRPIALLSKRAGLRQGEAFALSRAAILGSSEIAVTHQIRIVNRRLVMIPPKEQRSRRVPMPADLSRALTNHRDTYPTLTVVCECHGAAHELLFHDGIQPLTNKAWNPKYWHPAIARIGLGPTQDNSTGQHQLRHYYATVLLANGVDMYRLSKLLGHASVTITEKYYAHLRPGHHEETLRVLNGVEMPAGLRVVQGGRGA